MKFYTLYLAFSVRNAILFTLLLVSGLTSSCKKDANLDDPTVYLWKRDLYVESLFTENPIKQNASDDKPYVRVRTAPNTYLLSTDYVSLTTAQVNAELQKNEKSPSPGRKFYTYTKATPKRIN